MQLKIQDVSVRQKKKKKKHNSALQCAQCFSPSVKWHLHFVEVHGAPSIASTLHCFALHILTHAQSAYMQQIMHSPLFMPTVSY